MCSMFVTHFVEHFVTWWFVVQRGQSKVGLDYDQDLASWGLGAKE